MKLIVTYILVFLIGFSVFLIAFAPASLVWQYAEKDVTRALPQLQVLSVSGTIWKGNAMIRYRKFPDTRLDWTTDPMPLLRGGLNIHAIATGESMHLVADVRATKSGADIASTGEVGSNYINPVSEQVGLTYSGTLNVDRIHLVSDFRWFSQASGTLHWNGGQILYNTAQGPQSITLPALDGKLTKPSENLQLDISHQDKTLIGISLRPTGWVAVNIRGRLFQLASLPWPAGQSLDDIALTVEEQVFGG